MKDTQYARITISIPQNLLDWIDAEAQKLDRPRSWVMAKMTQEISEMRERENAQSHTPLEVLEKEKPPEKKRYGTSH